MNSSTEGKVETETVVLESLRCMAMYKRPRAAIDAFATLIALRSFETAHRGPWQRLIKLSWSGRPSVAAAAIKALVRARRAERRIPR